MSDIFDEVDEILSDVDMNVDETSATEIESNFNESELQDIMAEIESLEKEFEVETPAPMKKAGLQAQIEREIETSMEVSTEKKEAFKETKKEILNEPKVLSFEKKSSMTNTKTSEISFEANGQMSLNLGFKIGEERATLSIDPVLGLIITMNGVELSISQEEGCKVTMENGVKFTIPLTSTESVPKKKSA
jgi:hypothetical protein